MKTLINFFKKKTVVGDIIVITVVLVAATLLGCVFYSFDLEASNIIMLFILSVLLIAIFTNKLIYSIISAVLVILIFNFFFTEPRFTLQTLDSRYPITFAIMFIISIFIGTLTSRLKKQQEIISKVNYQKDRDSVKLEREKSKNNILRSVSQDIRTPLAAIISDIEELRKKKTLNTNLIGNIYDEANWLLKIVENLLSATKIDQGNLVITKEMHSAKEIVSEVLDRVNKHKSDFEIVTNLPDDIMDLEVDLGLIIQVLSNIFDNAIKYGNKKSVIKFIVTQSDTNVIFEVVNEGKNISELDLPHVFEMYYRADNDEDKSSDGVGLAVCKAIVQAHNGNIWAINKDENLVSFVVSLPKHEKTN